MEDKRQHMIHLMARKALGLMLSEQEESELTAWLGASDENRRIFEQVKTFQDADKMLRLERDGYARQMAKRVMRQLAVNGQSVVTAGSGGIAFCPARGANRSGESGGGFNFRQWGKVAYHGHNKRRGLERKAACC